MRLDAVAPFWHRLWSVRFALLSAVVAGAGQVLPQWAPVMGPVPYAVAASVLAVLSAISRVVPQGRVQRDLDARRAGEAHADSNC